MYEQNTEESGLLKKFAPQIAVAITTAINHDVIITDCSGTVVGAGDAAYIGRLHEPAKSVVSSGDGSCCTYKDPRDPDENLPGITCPIQSMNGSIVGAMAIIGNPDKVRPFAVIVKQQIEILLRERELYAYSVNRESTLQNLIQDIGSFVPGVSNEAMILSRASEFGYDRTWYYVPVAVDLYQFGRFALQIREKMRDESKNAETYIVNVKKSVLASIRKMFPETRDLSAMLGNNRFVVFYAAASGLDKHEHESEMVEEAIRRAEVVLQDIESLDLKAAIGIGSPVLGVRALATSYQESWKALFLGKKFRQRPGIYNIADYRLEDLITTIDASVRTRFVQAVTEKLGDYPDREQMHETIREWCESGFSLVEASRRLHIHRNTLIYRLDKIYKESGLNLKNFRTCLNLYLALVMDQYVGPAVKEKDL